MAQLRESRSICTARPTCWPNDDPTHRSFRPTRARGGEVTTLSAVAGYNFDASAAAMTLTYDAGGHQFVLTAKTPKSRAGTTRTLTLKLNDQSVHTQVVKC